MPELTRIHRTLSAVALLVALTTGAALAHPIHAAGAANAASSQDLLYVATLDWPTGTGSVYYYRAYGNDTKALGSVTFPVGYPEGLWTDSHGNVYVGVVNAGTRGHGFVNVYSPGMGKLLTTYTTGLDGPSGGTFDSAGNMYVSNLCGMDPTISCYAFARTRSGGSGLNGYVAVFPPGATAPSSYLQAGVNIAVSVAVDSNGNVFVPNNTGGIAWNVVEFPAGSTQGQVVRFKGLPSQVWVGAATFDPKGDLVISVNSTVDFFRHERGKASQQLTKGLLAPDGLAYGPDGTLFAGNYEFEQNEGNVLAFPPGATAAARTYAVPYNNGVVSVAAGAR